MSSTSGTPGTARFCSDCGTPLNPGARFCHSCGLAVAGAAAPRAAPPAASSANDSGSVLRWAVPTAAFLVLVVVIAVQLARRDQRTQPPLSGMPTGAAAGMTRAPDISSMSPEERADRLFNRVMRLSSEGKPDSVAFFAPMALGALEALTPLDAHRRYDIGLIALVTGDARLAAAQADTILTERRTHLLGLALAARAATAQGNAARAKDFQRRILAAEAAERAAGLTEYREHEPDVTAAITAARLP